MERVNWIRFSDNCWRATVCRGFVLLSVEWTDNNWSADAIWTKYDVQGLLAESTCHLSTLAPVLRNAEYFTLEFAMNKLVTVFNQHVLEIIGDGDFKLYNDFSNRKKVEVSRELNADFKKLSEHVAGLEVRFQQIVTAFNDLRFGLQKL